jgi:ribosomal protein S12 methylthiotransferase
MKYYLLTLGCPKNTVDSEGMHGVLVAQGHDVVTTPEQADVVDRQYLLVYSGCARRNHRCTARAGARKTAWTATYRCGVYAESHRDVLRQSVPELDATLSTKEWMRIDEVIGGRAAAGTAISSS